MKTIYDVPELAGKDFHRRIGWMPVWEAFYYQGFRALRPFWYKATGDLKMGKTISLFRYEVDVTGFWFLGISVHTWTKLLHPDDKLDFGLEEESGIITGTK